jgi:hypothetical protein
MSSAEIQQKLPSHNLLIRRPALGERAHRCLDATQTPDVGEGAGNGVALSSVELHGAELLGVVTTAVAAECPPPLPQPAATNPSTATASARAPVVAAWTVARTGKRPILTEPSGSPEMGAAGIEPATSRV